VKFRVFLGFIAPSMFLMLVFIAFPLVSVFIQSFYTTTTVYENVEVESCTPGFGTTTCVTETVAQPLKDENGDLVTETSFVGLESYKNILRLEEAFTDFSWSSLMAIDFWKALRFTLVFTLVTLPLAIGLGLLIALAVNNFTQRLRGQIIFISLLPFIITPVIGALSIRWLFIGDGILTAFLEWWLEMDIAMFAQAWTIELMMMFYRVWHVAPFAFVVFYAGLQTVNNDTLESAVIDGANRFERLRYVIIPHLMPLIVFISLIHLMDSYRVFEEIVGFSSQSYVISLQWLTYEFLTLDESGTRSIERASANSMMTMIGIVIILIPLLQKTWRDHKARIL